jgi:predicted polyphosphate/ATP-dependent NAD kinase
MSTIKELIENNKETKLGTWTLNMIPVNEKASRFLGKLHVTDKHIYFDAQFDVSLSGTVNSLIASAGAAAGHAFLVSKQIIDQWKDHGYVCIPKSEIQDIREKKSFLKKTVTVKLKDDSEYIFDYGMLSVSKIVEAIKK